MKPLSRMYGKFREFDHKPRRVTREHFFDAIVEVLAHHYGVEGTRPPDDTFLDNLAHQLERRTLMELQQVRDKLTVQGLKQLRDDRLGDKILANLTEYDITSPGDVVRVLNDPEHPAYRAVLDAFNLQKKGGRAKKKTQEEE